MKYAPSLAVTPAMIGHFLILCSCSILFGSSRIHFPSTTGRNEAGLSGTTCCSCMILVASISLKQAITCNAILRYICNGTSWILLEVLGGGPPTYGCVKFPKRTNMESRKAWSGWGGGMVPDLGHLLYPLFLYKWTQYYFKCSWPFYFY